MFTNIIMEDKENVEKNIDLTVKFSSNANLSSENTGSHEAASSPKIQNKNYGEYTFKNIKNNEKISIEQWKTAIQNTQESTEESTEIYGEWPMQVEQGGNVVYWNPDVTPLQINTKNKSFWSGKKPLLITFISMIDNNTGESGTIKEEIEPPVNKDNATHLKRVDSDGSETFYEIKRDKEGKIKFNKIEQDFLLDDNLFDVNPVHLKAIFNSPGNNGKKFSENGPTWWWSNPPPQSSSTEKSKGGHKKGRRKSRKSHTKRGKSHTKRGKSRTKRGKSRAKRGKSRAKRRRTRR